MTIDSSSNTAATNAANLASITRTADAQAAAKAVGSGVMGKDDFLKLFTAQLRNQDPTDPVKNEAFVAQLAQFSQLEATTNMAGALTQMASTMQGDRMMNAAGMIGRSITAPGLPANLTDGKPVTGTIALPRGASTVQIDIYDATGNAVRTMVAGTQAPGAPTFSWDGMDNNGKLLPDGAYSISTTAMVSGKSTTVATNMTSIVKSISTDPKTQALTVTDQSGQNIPLSSVISFGQ